MHHEGYKSWTTFNPKIKRKQVKKRKRYSRKKMKPWVDPLKDYFSRLTNLDDERQLFSYKRRKA